jgi:FtsP/CotA-like multicopper oxidase with cupredoxin domain
MALARRTFLSAGLAAAAWVWRQAPARAANEPADGFRVIEAGPASAQLAPAPAAPVQALGYGDATPGPLLRLRLGETLKVRLVNRLTEPTTLHWRGLRIANAMAGIGDLTQKPVAPGGSYDYAITPPDAGFAWYGPHGGVATKSRCRPSMSRPSSRSKIGGSGRTAKSI